jgi:alkyl sulfatase BDS1-like metallo-beta-lactamase superfamily hydrolase
VPTTPIPKAAAPATTQANAAVLKQLPFADQEDFQDAQRGFVATLPEGIIKTADGKTAWDLKAYEFLKQQDAPPTVNPSLWRMARLNMNNGLFQVTDRIYQVRGFDMSNMSIIEGDKGVMLVDPLISRETAQAALELYYQQRGKRPVVAVFYTHSHVDHYGGVKGVVSEADVKAGKVQIIAPDGFLEHAVSENVTAGVAMSRRAMFMYGTLLPRGEKGQVDGGLGKAVSLGAITLIPPTDDITKTGETRVIDGVEIVFQLTPGTEAPVEMTMYFPQFKAFDSAEIACPVLHNLLTMRGAEVRDASRWSYYLNEAIALYGDKTDVVFAQHHWPRWGRERVLTFLASQRDLYQYVHDQTLRLMNQGYTMVEIAEMMQLPASLDQQWYNRGYYGTLNHDVKAVYQKYLGWYDANPATLHSLPPVESGKKYVEYMGDPQAVIARARADFDKGEYRWVAQVMNHVVFAYPDNQEARNLEADALEQLGYQAEAATWRNAYLVGAFELRNGVPKLTGAGTANADTIKAMTLPMFFDYMGVRLNGPKADGKKIVLNWNFTDVGEKYTLNLENSALTYMAGRQAPNADATLTLTRATLDAITMGQTTFEKEVAAGNLKIAGNGQKLGELMGLLDTFDSMFNIVTP